MLASVTRGVNKREREREGSGCRCGMERRCGRKEERNGIVRESGREIEAGYSNEGGEVRVQGSSGQCDTDGDERGGPTKGCG